MICSNENKLTPKLEALALSSSEISPKATITFLMLVDSLSYSTSCRIFKALLSEAIIVDI
jgi:hypothetical protein